MTKEEFKLKFAGQFMDRRGCALAAMHKGQDDKHIDGTWNIYVQSRQFYIKEHDVTATVELDNIDSELEPTFNVDFQDGLALGSGDIVFLDSDYKLHTVHEWLHIDDKAIALRILCYNVVYSEDAAMFMFNVKEPLYRIEYRLDSNLFYTHMPFEMGPESFKNAIKSLEKAMQSTKPASVRAPLRFTREQTAMLKKAIAKHKPSSIQAQTLTAFWAKRNDIESHPFPIIKAFEVLCKLSHERERGK